MLHNEYETVIIVRPDLDDSQTYTIIESLEQVINGNEGHVLLRDDWGKRKLAYPIQKHQRGHYVLLNHLAPASLIAELERRIRIQDSIIRFLTVKKADAVDVPQRLEEAAEVRKARAAEAARRAEQEAQEAARHAGEDDN